MSVSLQLQIAPAGSERVLTRDQKRFNTLIRHIEQARATLLCWQEGMGLYRQAQLDVLAPLQAQLKAALRQWALALDAAAAGRWSRSELQTLDESVAAAAGELLSNGDGDAQLHALFARHAGMDYETAMQQSLQAMKEVAGAAMGVDLGDLEGVATHEDMARHLHERLRQQQEAAAERRERPAAARKTAARLRREQEAQRASQSIREVFRKLAAALHPDREMDPQRRAAKTTLMAQVNEAYGRGDLLGLLELQLRIEQIDADHLANVDEGRLKHYNKVLAEQLAELRAQVDGAADGFVAELGLQPRGVLDPRQLGKIVEAEAGRMRAMATQLRREAELFREPAWTRRWLKERRRSFQERPGAFF